MNKSKDQACSWNNFWTRDHIPGNGVSWSKKRIISRLEPYLKRGTRVIDAGCGSGFFSHFFQRQGMDVLALDYSESALQLCRQKCDNKVRIEKFDLLNESLKSRFGQNFGLVFSDGLLEHFTFKDQICLLRNFAEATTPGGVVFTIVPNRFSPWQLVRPLFMPGIEESPLTLKKLIRLNHLAGLKIREAGGLNVLPIHFSPEASLGNFFGMLLFTASEAVIR